MGKAFMSVERKNPHFAQVLDREYERLVNDSRVLRTAHILSDQNLSNSILILGDETSPEYCMIEHEIVRVAKVESRLSFLNERNPYSTDKQSRPGRRFNGPITRRIVNCYFRFAAFRSMLAAILSEQPDAIWSNDYSTLKVSAVAKLLSPSKPILIYDSHELWAGSRDFLGNRKILSPFVRKLEKYLIQHYVDFVVSVNREIAELISYGKPSYVIHNIPHYQVGAYNRNYFYDRYSLSLNSKILLYLGGFSTGRGIEFLLRASKEIDSDIKVVFMGYGPLKAYMTDYIRQNGLGDKCFVHPAVLPSEVMKYVPAAHIGLSLIEPICTSYYYALPNKFWEYVIGGLPLITSDLPSMSTLVRRHFIGTTMESFIPGEFRNALNKLLSDYDNYKSNVILYSRGLIARSKEQYSTLLRDVLRASQETWIKKKVL